MCGRAAALDLLKTVLAEFDYRNLDELAEFRARNTTREFLACPVHKRVVRRIKEGALGSQASTSLRVVLRENQVLGRPTTRRSDDQAPSVCFASA